jgi:CheY-like chemotaxis protein
VTDVRIARVLAVDDRRANLLALESILDDLAVEVESVTSGEAALKALMSADYAVILLDAHMPSMDGFETAQHIKLRETTRHIPIIFLTGMDYDTRLAFRGFELGAVDYLVKPFDPRILRSKVGVFADLWTMRAELWSHARECRILRSAMAEAVEALEAHAPDPARASARLRGVLDGATEVPDQQVRQTG